MITVVCHRILRSVTAALSLLFMGGMAARAADTDISGSDWDGLSSGIYGLYGSMYRLLEVVMGLGALIAVARVAVKMYQGEKEAASRLVWWFIGFVFGLVMLAVIKGLFN